jgi:hypothetical protein
MYQTSTFNSILDSIVSKVWEYYSVVIGNAGILRFVKESVMLLLYITCFYVVKKDLDIFVSVRSTLLMKEAQSVHYFMKYCAK